MNKINAAIMICRLKKYLAKVGCFVMTDKWPRSEKKKGKKLSITRIKGRISEMVALYYVPTIILVHELK